MDVGHLCEIPNSLLYFKIWLTLWTLVNLNISNLKMKMCNESLCWHITEGPEAYRISRYYQHKRTAPQHHFSVTPTDRLSAFAKNTHSTHLCSTIEPENVFHLIILKIPSHPLANVILHARSVIMLHNVAMWVSFTPQCSPKWLEWTTPNVFCTGHNKVLQQVSFCTCICSTGAFHSIWLALVSLILQLSPSSSN